MDPTPSSTGVQVERSSQSNRGVPEREPTRTGRPRASRRSTTRRPVLPVPPSTSVGFVSPVLPVIVAPLVEFGRPVSDLELGLSMAERPYFMLERPYRWSCRSAIGILTPVERLDPWPPSDPVGEALHFLRMNGAFYCRSELTAPWGLTLPPMPGYIWFHVPTAGRLWLESGDAEPRLLTAGALWRGAPGGGARPRRGG